MESLKDLLSKQPSEVTDIQEKIGEESKPTAKGFIRNLVVTPRLAGDSLYKFQLRYLDSNDNIVEPETWYSGFKQAPGVDGDYIVFEYKINGDYNNVKEVLNIKLTHDKIDDVDKELLDNVKKVIDEPTLSTDLDGDNVTITQVKEELSPEGLSEPYRALLLNATIQLCTRRGTISEDEIVAQYNRFLKIV